MAYEITTKRGSELLRSLGSRAGDSVTATDGSVWTRQKDGSVIARGTGGDTAVVRDLYSGSTAEARDVVADAAERNRRRTEEMQNLYQSGTDKMTAYLAEAAQVAADMQIAKWNAQKGSTQDEYEKMLRQLYVERAQSEQNLAQLLAAAGLSGGASESTRLGLDTAYVNAMREETNERDAALRALDMQIAQARQTAQMKALELYADAEKSRLSGYAGALKAAIAEENDARDAIVRRADTARSEALGIVQKILALGGTPSEELLRTAQLGDADAAALYVEPETEEEKPPLTLAQAITAIQSGTVSDAVKNAYDYYMGEGAYDRFASTVAAQKKTSGGSSKKSSAGKTAEEKAKEKASALEEVHFSYDEQTGHFTWQGKTYTKRGDFLFALRTHKLTTAQKEALEQQCRDYDIPVFKFDKE